MILFPTGHPFSNKTWNEYVKYLLQLDIDLDSTVTPDELYFLLELLEINVATPEGCNKDPNSGSVALDALIDLEATRHKVEEDEHKD